MAGFKTMKQQRRYFKTLFTVAALACVVSLQALPANAVLTVPPMEMQQRGLLTRFYYEAAIQVAQQGGVDIAGEMMERVYAINRGNIRAALTYGEVLKAQKQYEQALSFFQSSLPDFEDSREKALMYYSISLLQDTLNKSQQAINTMQKAVHLYPGEPPAGFFYDLGVMYAKINRYEQTKVYSQKAVEKSPDFAAAWNNFGYSLARLGDYSEGFSAVKRSLDLEPNNPNALDSMGFILFHQGRFQESILEYEKAIKIDPQLAESFLYLGKSYESLKNWEKAVEAYEKYLQVAPVTPEKPSVEKRLLELKAMPQSTQPLSEQHGTPESVLGNHTPVIGE